MNWFLVMFLFLLFFALSVWIDHCSIFGFGMNRFTITPTFALLFIPLPFYFQCRLLLSFFLFSLPFDLAFFYDICLFTKKKTFEWKCATHNTLFELTELYIFSMKQSVFCAVVAYWSEHKFTYQNSHSLSLFNHYD